MKDRHWHLITDEELAALLREQGCSHVDTLVAERDTIHGDSAIEEALSRKPAQR